MSSEIEGKSYWIKRSKRDKRKDWLDNSPWIEGYMNSRNHPHRDLIIWELSKLCPFESLVEVGCNAGPNLFRISVKFSSVKLTGVDINEDSLAVAKKYLPKVEFVNAAIGDLPFQDYFFDVSLADAVLMYVEPREVPKSLWELSRVSKRAVIIVDWDSNSRPGIIKDYHWARDYKSLMEDLGFKVEKIKITEEQWPTKSWTEHGYVFVCQRV